MNLPPDLRANVSGPPAERRCGYCGHLLRENVYFCVACAKPYKSVESLLPAAMPPYVTDGMLVAARAPQVAPVFWTFFAIVVGAALVSAMAGGSELYHYLIQDVASLAAVSALIFRYWPSLGAQLRRIGFLKWEAWAGLLVLLPLLLGINYAYSNMLRAMGAEFRSEDLLREWDFATIVTLVCVFPAIIEEIAFRGMLQHWLQAALRPWSALMLASALFTVMHFSIVSAPYIFLIGLLLGWMKQRTGSLYPSILAHFLHNFAVVAVLYKL